MSWQRGGWVEKGGVELMFYAESAIKTISQMQLAEKQQCARQEI